MITSGPWLLQSVSKLLCRASSCLLSLTEALLCCSVDLEFPFQRSWCTSCTVLSFTPAHHRRSRAEVVQGLPCSVTAGRGTVKKGICWSAPVCEGREVRSGGSVRYGMYLCVLRRSGLEHDIRIDPVHGPERLQERLHSVEVGWTRRASKH